MPRPATSALSAAPQSLQDEEDVPSIITRRGGQAKTTTPVPARCLPTRVAISPLRALSSRLPAVSVAAVLRVTRILRGQARGLRLGNAALCVSGGGQRFQRGIGRADWPLHPLYLFQLPRMRGSGSSTTVQPPSPHYAAGLTPGAGLAAVSGQQARLSAGRGWALGFNALAADLARALGAGTPRRLLSEKTGKLSASHQSVRPNERGCWGGWESQRPRRACPTEADPSAASKLRDPRQVT